MSSCMSLGVLCCFALFVCLTLLASSFFLLFHLSLKHVHVHAVPYTKDYMYSTQKSKRLCKERREIYTKTETKTKNNGKSRNDYHVVDFLRGKYTTKME